jgi:hypothetical protein
MATERLHANDGELTLARVVLERDPESAFRIGPA